MAKPWPNQVGQFQWSGDPKKTYPDGAFQHFTLRELISRKEPNYSALPYGSPYPWVGEGVNPFSEFELVFEADLDDGETVARFWSAPRLAQNSYNVAKYDNDEDNRDYPQFVRIYIVSRLAYESQTDPTARDMLSPLGSLTGISIESEGSGYVPTVPPPRNANRNEQTPLYLPLTFTGGGGSGAAGFALILEGKVKAVYLSNDGQNYTSQPTVTLGGGGSGAAFHVNLQETDTVLVMEDAKPWQTENDPIGSRYIAVTQTYWTLPGALVPSSQMDESAQGAITTTTRQKVAMGTAAPSLDYTVLSWQDRAYNDNVLERYITELAASEGGVFPILTEYDQDDTYLSLITTTYQVVDASAVVAPTIVPGQITSYKKIDKWRSLKIVRTFALPDDVTEYSFGAWTRPYLFDFENATTPYQYTDECGAFGVRYSQQSVQCPHKIITKFSNTVDTTQGVVFNMNAPLLGKYLNFQNIINDEVEFTYTGSCTGTVTVPASVPDFTTYTGTYQGTFQLVQVSSKLWKALRFISEYLYVQMP